MICTSPCIATYLDRVEGVLLLRLANDTTGLDVDGGQVRRQVALTIVAEGEPRAL